MVVAGTRRSWSGLGMDYSGPNDLLRFGPHLAKSRADCAGSIAGNGNRTRMASLEGWNFTIKLCPHGGKLPRHGGAANSFFECASHESGIVAAEAERIIQGDSHLLFAGDVWRVIEVTFFVGIFQIDCRRNHRITNGQRARGHLDSTSPA